MRIMFIVPTNLLANQQGKMCKKYLTQWKSYYTGGGIAQDRIAEGNEEFKPLNTLLSRLVLDTFQLK